MKISQRITLSGLNVNHDLLFQKLSAKLADKDNMILKIKGLLEENSQESRKKDPSSIPKKNNSTNNINNNMKKPTNGNNTLPAGHLSVSLNKHQGGNKKEIINKKAGIISLLQWAKQVKIFFRKIHLNLLNNGFEMAKSDNPIKKGDAVLTVPKQFILTSHSQTVKDKCQEIKKISELQDEHDLICLSLALKAEASSKGHLKEFIHYLYENVKFNNFPMFYNQEEIKLIKGSYFYSLVSARKSLYKLQYSILNRKNIFRAENYSEEDYIKARVIVNSKFFSLNINGNKASGLVPLADLFTSKAEKPNCELIQSKNGSVTLKATESINKKDSIKLSLGKNSNYHYLINYGFTSVNNAVPLEVYLDLRIKNEMGDAKKREVLLSKDYDVNKSLTKLRKIVQKLSNEKTGKSKNYDLPKNIENELESLRVLRGGLKSQLSNYATNIKDDIIKSSKSKNFNESNILNILIEEKKVNLFFSLNFFISVKSKK